MNFYAKKTKLKFILLIIVINLVFSGNYYSDYRGYINTHNNKLKLLSIFNMNVLEQVFRDIKQISDSVNLKDVSIEIKEDQKYLTIQYTLQNMKKIKYEYLRMPWKFKKVNSISDFEETMLFLGKYLPYNHEIFYDKIEWIAKFSKNLWWKDIAHIKRRGYADTDEILVSLVYILPFKENGEQVLELIKNNRKKESMQFLLKNLDFRYFPKITQEIIDILEENLWWLDYQDTEIVYSGRKNLIAFLIGDAIDKNSLKIFKLVRKNIEKESIKYFINHASFLFWGKLTKEIIDLFEKDLWWKKYKNVKIFLGNEAYNPVELIVRTGGDERTMESFKYVCSNLDKPIVDYLFRNTAIWNINKDVVDLLEQENWWIKIKDLKNKQGKLVLIKLVEQLNIGNIKKDFLNLIKDRIHTQSMKYILKFTDEFEKVPLYYLTDINKQWIDMLEKDLWWKDLGKLGIDINKKDNAFIIWLAMALMESDEEIKNFFFENLHKKSIQYFLKYFGRYVVKKNWKQIKKWVDAFEKNKWLEKFERAGIDIYRAGHDIYSDCNIFFILLYESIPIIDYTQRRDKGELEQFNKTCGYLLELINTITQDYSGNKKDIIAMVQRNYTAIVTLLKISKQLTIHNIKRQVQQHGISKFEKIAVVKYLNSKKLLTRNDLFFTLEPFKHKNLSKEIDVMELLGDKNTYFDKLFEILKQKEKKIIKEILEKGKEINLNEDQETVLADLIIYAEDLGIISILSSKIKAREYIYGDGERFINDLSKEFYTFVYNAFSKKLDKSNVWFTKAPATRKEILKKFKNALDDFKIAKQADIAKVKFKFLYDSLIGLGITLLNFYHIKPESNSGHHINILRAMAYFLNNENIKKTGDKMRVKRNKYLYKGGINISPNELKKYEKLVQNVLKRVKVRTNIMIEIGFKDNKYERLNDAFFGVVFKEEIVELIKCYKNSYSFKAINYLGLKLFNLNIVDKLKEDENIKGFRHYIRNGVISV
ncbi:hypothetical protein ACFL4S_00500 [bacterium]